MKLAVIVAAGFALIALNRVAVADDWGQTFVLKVADQVDTIVPPHASVPPHARRHHRPAHRYSYSPYPVACEAVIFPRSPLCAGRPATFGRYAPFPWNMYWYY